METRNENKNLENRIPPIHDETHQGNLPDEQPGCSLIKRSGKGKRKLWSQNFQNDINKPKVSVAEIDTVHPDFNRNNTEDKDFVKKSDSPPKSTSNSTEGRVESPVLTRRIRMCRVNNPPIYTEISDSRAVRKKKPAKKGKKTSKPNVGIGHFVELADERRRNCGPQVLDCSIAGDKYEPGKTEHVTNVLLHAPPETDEITDDQINKVPAKIKRKIWATKAKLQVVLDKEDNRTVSPPPGLAVETMPSRHKNSNYKFSARALQLFKEMYQDSLQNTSDEVCFINDRKEQTSEWMSTKTVTTRRNKTEKVNSNTEQQNKTCSINKNINIDNNKDKNEILSISDITDDESVKSISTDGITAHGDWNEAPPSLESLNKSVQPRETVDLNTSLRNLYMRLHREICDPSPNQIVRNWLRNMESSQHNDVDTNLSVKELLEYIMERFKTTVDNINESTSYNFENLITSIRTELVNRRKERQTWKEEFISQVTDHINVEIDELVQRLVALISDLEGKLMEIAHECDHDD